MALQASEREENGCGLQLVEESPYFWKGEPRLFPRSRPVCEESHKLVDLFCGMGGISIGLEWAGFEPILGLDIHVPSIETYRYNHPSAVTILGDIRKIIDLENNDASSVLLTQAESVFRETKVDVLAAGIPCQGFSLNNRKRSAADHRNYLFLYLLKAAELLKPRSILIENVPSMGSTSGGEFVRAIEENLNDLGYVVESKVLNAAEFGVPQIRKRLFFIALAQEENVPILWPEGEFGRSAERSFRTVEEAISDLPSLRPGETATVYRCEPVNDYQRLMRLGCGSTVTNHEAPRHPPSTIQRISNTPPGEPMYPEFPQRIRLHPKSPSPTQVSGGIRPQFQFGHPVDARGLSVRERCRLQSIPDWVYVCGGVVQGRVQTGNAVPPLLAQALGRALSVCLRTTELRRRLLDWWRTNKRHFPWRERGRTVYEIFVAEFLLRKTRAESTSNVYLELLKTYPRLVDLANASKDDIATLLKPLGLHHVRAGALIKVARKLQKEGFVTELPCDYEKLTSLPHVGRYIANAVLCFAMGEPRALVDANVQRVFNRVFSLPVSQEVHRAELLWRAAEVLLDKTRPQEHNWALLDFGATVCTPQNPKCGTCPIGNLCDQHRARRLERMMLGV